MMSTDTTRPNTSAPLMSAALDTHYAHMGTQGKLGKDAVSVACYARERSRTPIQRRHACSYAVDPLDQGQQDREHHDPESDGDDIHTRHYERPYITTA
jgi:hypothetical protein